MYAVVAPVKAELFASSRSYVVALGGAVQLTVKLPDIEEVGTVIVGGGLGGTIWQPFVLVVQLLWPTALLAHTLYHHVPELLFVTLKDVLDPL